MGDPAQILVVEEGDDNEVRLYVHYGGPHNVIPAIKRAWKMMKSADSYPGIAAKVGSFLCAAAPGEVVPEDKEWPGLLLAFQYVLYLAHVPRWEAKWTLEIQQVSVSPETYEWGDLEVVVPATSLEEVEGAYKAHADREHEAFFQARRAIGNR